MVIASATVAVNSHHQTLGFMYIPSNGSAWTSELKVNGVTTSCKGHTEWFPIAACNDIEP